MKELRIAYIHPSPHGGVEGSHIPLDGFQHQPAGLVGALNLLRSTGTILRGINLPIELRLDPGFSLEDWLTGYDPQLVLIDLHWYVHTHGALDVARRAKAAVPGCTAVLGGLTASAFAEEILRDYPTVDYIVAGEGERPLQILAQNLRKRELQNHNLPNLWTRRSDGTPCPPSTRWVAGDLDDLNHIDLSWMDHLADYECSDFPYRNRWLLTGRGCSKSCFFCGGSRESLKRLWGRNSVLIRSPHRVAEDIVALALSGVKAVHLTHDLLTLGRDHWRRLFSDIAATKIKVGLGNESWGPVPDREFLDSWAEILDVQRSYIALSPTSAWSGLRRFASRSNEDEKLLDSIEYMARLKIPLHLFFLLNVPGETLETIERTLDLAWAAVSIYPEDLLRIEAQTASIDPASPAALGTASRLNFQSPTFNDYLSVSSGSSVQSLNWPLETRTIDPGRPISVPKARPKEILQLGRRCPSLVQRWQNLLTENRR